MDSETTCPKCSSVNVYADGNMWVCPECSHEWSQFAATAPNEQVQLEGVRDAFGNPLQDGDSVTVIKDLKVKGSSSVVKVGTKVKNIRISDGGDGHDISCRIEGFGFMNLKSEFVKKA